MNQIPAQSQEVAKVSVISFRQSLDVIEDSHNRALEETRDDKSTLVYLNTMVLEADKQLVKQLKRRTGLSEGLIVREIFAQWREMMLRGCDAE